MRKATGAQSPAMPAIERKHEVEDALRTLRHAEEVKNNPQLMRDVKKLARDEQKVLQRISGAKK